MASAIVSSVMRNVFSFLGELAKRKAEQKAYQMVEQVMGVEEDIGKLHSNLYDIQAVLEDADRKQLENKSVQRWLYKLKEVSYDIDDLVDEWNTAILKRQIEEGENAPGKKRKVWSINPLNLVNSFSGQVAGHLDIINKIKELKGRLDDINNERHKFNFTFMKGAEELERQITASVIDPSDVHGREQDKNAIVEKLLSESSQGSILRIISIVGMGGLGKTTLAQLVYNNEKVNACFQKRIWVCVSDPFDEIRIAKAILEALEGSAPNLNEVDSVLRRICDCIDGKKFLIVLDDVWTEDYSKFEQLKNSLKCGSPESIILVTTRNKRVAKNMGTNDTDMFSLGELSNEECWLLFSQVAFWGRSSEQYEILKDIGRGIADKCKGLPLAAKVLGSLLRFKNTKKEWQDVLDTQVLNLDEAEKRLFPSLLLSYYDLSPTLRQCFSYCAIFPKDYEMQKDRLIQLWMAQGYLRATRSIDMEMVGEECFKNLTMRFFFQKFGKDIEGTIIYKMHDIVHDFAQFITENECGMVEVNGLEKSRLDFSCVNTRHSMLMIEKSHSFPASIKNVKHLRSLVVKNNGLQMTSAVLSEVFDQLTCLRTLDLSQTYSITELPKEIEKLIHLKYLNLARNSKLKELPETICNLCNLQSLNVWGCGDLEKLPHEFGKLINLRHLQIGFTWLNFMPKGVERLTSLRTLDTFYRNRSGVNDSEAFTLKDLKNLNDLRGNLCIHGLGGVRHVDEMKGAQLGNKKHLTGLKLFFYEAQAERNDEAQAERNDEEVIEAMQAPPNLEELSICYYIGTRVFPNWIMSLTNLKKIEISNCMNCELLPPLGKLSSLESLLIDEMKGVKRVGIEFLGLESSSSSMIAFPQLKELDFQCMKNWEEWDYGITRRMGEEEDITTATTIFIMPRLRSLQIWRCPKLKELPDHLLHSTSLEKLVIDSCPILAKRYSKERKGEDWPKISHIPYIKIHWNPWDSGEESSSDSEDSGEESSSDSE